MLAALLGPKFWIDVGLRIVTASPIPDFSMLDRMPEEPANTDAEPEAQDPMAVQVPGTQKTA